MIAKNMTRMGTACVIAVLAGLGVGQFCQPVFFKLLVPLALFMMLFPAMVNIEINKIKETLGAPRILGLTLFLNYVLSPLLIVAIVRLFFTDAHADLSAGLILYGIIPCGGMVPAFTSMKNGNVSLAVTTTAVNLLISILAVPIWTPILLGRIFPVPLLLIGKYLLVIIAVPLTLAEISRKLFIRRYGEATFQKAKQRIKGMQNYGLMLMLFILFALNGKRVFNAPGLILNVMCPTAVFLATLFFVSRLFSSLFRMRAEDATAFIFCTTAKNNAVAMALAITAFGPEAALTNAVAGPLVQLPMLLIYLHAISR